MIDFNEFAKNDGEKYTPKNQAAAGIPIVSAHSANAGGVAFIVMARIVRMVRGLSPSDLTVAPASRETRTT